MRRWPKRGSVVQARSRALADRLQWLHAHRWLGQTLGRAGMRRVRARFTWERVAADLADVYLSLAEAGKRRAAPVARAAAAANLRSVPDRARATA